MLCHAGEPMKKQDIASQRLQLKREIKMFLIDQNIKTSLSQLNDLADASTGVLEIMVKMVNRFPEAIVETLAEAIVEARLELMEENDE